MTCPQCQAPRREGARFCEECGARLDLCPACGHQTTAGQRFCASCGADLPSPVVSGTTVASRPHIEGERKQVTVLFADVTGSMALLAGRDPEDARDILDPLLSVMMDAVHRYEGTVNQVMGDGIMALFGAPVAHEDHAARACYAALAMQERVRRHASAAGRDPSGSVALRVGINSGEVVVRAIGNDIHMDYSAIGETTHVASRMEASAPPGSIHLTRATLGLAEPFIHARPVGPLVIKGKPEPVDVFELVAARAIGRSQAAALRGLTRFVGREDELAALRRAVERVTAGRGGVVAVAGEHGVGKSRLLLEFTQSPWVAGSLVLQAGTVSYGRSTAYLPILDLLRRYFGLQEGRPAAAVRETVARTLRALDGRLADTATPVLALLGAVPDDSAFPTYDPLRRRELTQEALTTLFVRLSETAPLVLIVEDLQWIDPETQAFLDRLVEGIETTRILLLVNYRPEYRPPWTMKQDRDTRIGLTPLDRDSAEQLLSALVGDSGDVRPLKDLLIERANGNPFFLEESVRALIDNGSLVGEPGRYRPAGVVHPDVPRTVRAVLAARIDRLPPEHKRLVQCASVIGRDVRRALLEAIAELPPSRVGSVLDDLRAAELLVDLTGAPEPTYAFRHSLTQEVAYAGLLHNQAKALHASVVSAIERLYPERLADHVEALAHHAVRGEVWPKAVDSLRQAGAAAFQRGSIEESLSRYEQALALADRLDASPHNVARRIDVRLDLHVPLIVLGQVSRLIELHEESERLAAELQDSPRRGRLLYRMSQYAWMQGRFRDGLQRAEAALGIARSIGDAEVATLASYALGLNQCLLGDYRAAIALFQSIVDGPEAGRAKRLLAVTVPAYVGAACWLGDSLTLVGELERALHYSALAVQAADESDHPQAQAVAYTLRALPLLYAGQIEAAVALSERALRLCETRALLVWLPGAAATVGWVLTAAGRAPEGAAHLERGATTMEAIGVSSNLSRIHAWWAEALLAAGRAAQARRAAERGVELAQTYGEQGYEAEAFHALGRVLAASGGTDAAASASYDRAIQLAAKLGMLPLVGRCHLGYGRLHAAAGHTDLAASHFDRAAALFRERRIHLWLAEAEARGRRADRCP
jgi:class 3 adenylate cyclase/tetratricopeptide (TPR) repeat protein